jgi:hypothetical protein
MKPEQSRIGLGVRCVMVACLLLMMGCRSTEKSPKPFASVTITGNTPGQIREAATDVFHSNGYHASEPAPGKLLFEKRGGAMSNFAYGSWLGDDPVWIRVKALIMPAGEMTYRLQCSAFMVRDRGGATEEEVALTRLHHGSYQKLLDEVANRLTRK